MPVRRGRARAGGHLHPTCQPEPRGATSTSGKEAPPSPAQRAGRTSFPAAQRLGGIGRPGLPTTETRGGGVGREQERERARAGGGTPGAWRASREWGGACCHGDAGAGVDVPLGAGESWRDVRAASRLGLGVDVTASLNSWKHCPLREHTAVPALRSPAPKATGEGACISCRAPARSSLEAPRAASLLVRVPRGEGALSCPEPLLLLVQDVAAAAVQGRPPAARGCWQGRQVLRCGSA